ncbi:WD repeat-containing protein 65 [Planoprotostelium fungivorum]|uniref:WD repeat-containing protein 65 n=1 Tax=Planoprotostelium fungivorum TaxID=1890364 RepID=A0A2P6N6F9_9EUKA|nr:WD repeat-containing protein 65 [Planoprotostelium fungivorum]
MTEASNTKVNQFELITPQRLVVAGITSREINFIPEYEQKLRRINAICVSNNKKWLAVSEVIESGAQISIVNLTSLKRVSVLKIVDGREMKGLSFTVDGRYLASYSCIISGQTPTSAGPAPTPPTLPAPSKPLLSTDGIIYDTTICFWNVERQTVHSQAKFNENIAVMLVSPFSSAQILTVGKKSIRLFKTVEGNLHSFSPAKKDTQYHNYTAAVWLGDGIFAAATDNGDIQVYQDMELKRTYTNLFDNGGHAKLIRSTVQGFTVADSLASVYIFEKNVDIMSGKVVNGADNQPEFFKLVRTDNTNQTFPLVHIMPSPDESHTFCLFDNNSLISYQTSDREQGQSFISDSHSSTSHIKRNAKISTGFYFHLGPIAAMDVCFKRPVLVTCGFDRTIRAWNYNDKSMELLKSVAEEPLGICIHPLGTQLTVAFQNKLRIYAFAFGDIIEEMSMSLKASKEMQYSHGGHCIAVVVNNITQLYSTITWELLYQFKGHTNVVRALAWSHDDRRLVSAGFDGVVYQWSTHDGSRCDEHVIKGLQYSAVAFVPYSNQLLVAGNDGFLRHIGKKTASPSASTQVLSEYPVGTDRVTSTGSTATIGTGYVIAGTVAGVLRIISFPMTSHDARDYYVHNGPITSVRCSDGYLFTSSEDGTVFMFKMAISSSINNATTPDLVLVTKLSMEQQQGSIQELENKHKELLSRSEYIEGLIKKQFEEQLTSQRKDFEMRLQAEVDRFDEMNKQKITQEISFREASIQKEKDHIKASEELEKLYDRRLKDATTRYEELRTLKEDTQFQLEEQMRVTQLKHQQDLKSKQDISDQRLKEEVDKTAAKQREVEFLHSQQVEELDQQEEEYEFEIAVSQEKASRLMQGENTLLRRRTDMLIHDHDHLLITIAEKDKEIDKHKKRIQLYEENIESLRKEMDERNYTIGQKETRILEIKQKNQELEKYRFVLDFKIEELKEELNPKDIMMNDMRAQIKEMDEELQRTLRSNDQLEILVEDRNLKIDALQRDNKEYRIQVNEKEKLIRMFVEDVHKLYSDLDSSQWRSGVKQLYQTYVTQDSKRKITKEDQERMKELARQRQYMEHSLGILKDKALRGEQRLKTDVQRKVSENTSLISDLNELRRENWDLKSKIVILENQFKSGEHKAAERVKSREPVDSNRSQTSLTFAPRGRTAPVGFIPEDRLRVTTPKLNDGTTSPTAGKPFPNLPPKVTRSLSNMIG